MRASNICWRLLLGLWLAVLPVSAAESGDKGAADKEEAKAEQEFQAFMDKLTWTKGPAKAAIGDIGQITVPEGFKLADAKSTQKLLKAMGNPISETELGLLAPTSMVWSVIFEFSDVGYVKDDDKDKLDADKILKSIKEGNDEANKQRKEMGVAPLNLVGWEMPPKYNEKTHNLEWAIRGESEGRQVINYNTRLLGRKGVMEVNLIVRPDRMAETLPAYQKILADYTYNQGENYAEYRQGDKVAKYGLAALVVGGAAIGAAKLGLLAWVAVFFKKAWKVVVLGVAAVAGWIKKLFSGRGKNDDGTSA